MNETNFATYDSYFCSTNYQVSDNALMDYDMLAPQNYLNNTSCDLVDSAEQRHHLSGQTNMFPFISSHTREEQDRIKESTANLRVANKTGGSAGPVPPKAYANIPFVQIHTTDVQQRTSYGNVFRRNVNRQEEIKSEPIKSESADAASKERTNATPTPPRAPSASQQNQSEDKRTVTTSNCQSDNVKAINSTQGENIECIEHEGESNKVPFTIFKCSTCPYISLKEQERDEHERSQHGDESKQETVTRVEIKCPGCCNIFFVQQSLEVHLKLDHYLADDDISILMKSLAKLNSNVTQDTSKERIEDHTNVDQPPRKSRIYLKNVECLREPNRQPIEQTENQLSGNNKNNNNSSEVQNQNFKPPKQKISIKSVDVLREPALLMRDYERENVHFSFYIGDSNEITTLNIPVTPNTYGEFNPSGDGMLVNTTNKNDHQKNIVDDNVGCNAADVLEKPRKPKIYVKSVESFNLMPVQSSNTEYISDHSNVLSSYMYESNTISTNETNNNLTFINDNHTENMDTNYHVINNNSNPNVGNYSIMENPIYVSNINVEDINCGGQLENVTLITEPTPPPPPHISLNVEEVVHFTDKSFSLSNQEQQRGTLHLRTVDELNLMNENEIQNNSNVTDMIHFNTNKNIPPNQEQRGTLHLRTVDELNLMNENEVQHLIAPNLDNNHGNNNNGETISHNINMSDDNLIGDSIYETEAFKFHDLDSQMANEWPETYEDLAEDINGIITDVTNTTNSDNRVENPNTYSLQNNQKNLCSNLDRYDNIDTPQVSLITIRDIEELTGVTGMQEAQYSNFSNDNNITGLTLVTPVTSTTIGDQINTPSEVIGTIPTTPTSDDSAQNLKRELSNATPETKDSTSLKTSCDHIVNTMNVESVSSPTSSTEMARSPIAINALNTHPQSIPSQCSSKTTEVEPSNVLQNTDLLNSVTELAALSPRQSERSTRPNHSNLNNKLSNAVVTSELPPLVPVTNSINSPASSSLVLQKQPSPPPQQINNDIPLPPLVPVPPLIKLNKNTALTQNPSASITAPLIQENSTSTPQAPLEKGRIYVANNLMEPPKKPVAVSCGTSIRGRPFGSNRTRTSQQLKQQQGIAADDMFVKCSVKGCAFRFKKSETLEYHIKCHDTTSINPQSTICPECKSTEFNNWNTLHTHLWRAHQIDMELYKCELCDFKTPIFSRLVNTHAKIHFDDRNYKCEQCGKGFKNSKQLKNHRRWHRVQASNVTAPPPKELTQLPSVTHQCADCGSTFSHQKTLKEHCCKSGSNMPVKCDICHKQMSTKSSLKLHLLTHNSCDEEKRFKCQECEYTTNDHNAFRRHRMGHENKKMYECQFCDYKSVQSITYQKHILRKHIETADSIIHKCNHCSFTTINRSLLSVHQAKHHKQEISKNEDDVEINRHKDCLTDNNILDKSLISSTVTSDVQKSKIKVKSNLFTL